MSGGQVCRCPEAKKPLARRRWRVRDRNCHHSAFAGGHWTYSRYSAVHCLACRSCWRTTAAYVDELRDG